jgi:hypothetical protein
LPLTKPPLPVGFGAVMFICCAQPDAQHASSSGRC